jgi:hypothetical protein
MSNDGPVGDSRTDVIDKVNVSASQTAGSYTNVVVYTATANF